MTVRQQLAQVYLCGCQQDQIYAKWAKRHGMSPNTAAVLYALDQDRPYTQGEIVREWMIPKQTVHTVVKDLERRGLLRLEAGRGQKEKRLTLTEEGRAFVWEQLSDLHAREKRAAEAVGAEQIQTMAKIYQAFTEALAKEVQQ